MKKVKVLYHPDGQVAYIQLTHLLGGKPVTLIGRNILSVSPHGTDNGHTNVYMIGGEIIRVKETYEDIIRAFMGSAAPDAIQWWFED